jgi:hypothetical protein
MCSGQGGRSHASGGQMREHADGRLPSVISASKSAQRLPESSGQPLWLAVLRAMAIQGASQRLPLVRAGDASMAG